MRNTIMVGLGAAVAAAAVALAPTGSASANHPEYHIECFTYPAPVYGEAGGCVEWSNGNVTWYAFDTSGNWWVVA